MEPYASFSAKRRQLRTLSQEKISLGYVCVEDWEPCQVGAVLCEGDVAPDPFSPWS